MLTINPSELILTILNFFVLLYVLKRFFYTPLMTFMDKRRERIEEGLEQEKKAFAMIRELERFLASRRKEREDEANRIIADAQAADKLRRDQVIAQAKEQFAEDRKNANDAAAANNAEEQRQLKDRRNQLSELLAESLVTQFSREPLVMLLDGRSMDSVTDAERYARVKAKMIASYSEQSLPKGHLFAPRYDWTHEVEQRRDEEERQQLAADRELLATMLAERLLKQVPQEEFAAAVVGCAHQTGSRRKSADTVVQMPFSAAQEKPDKQREALQKQEAVLYGGAEKAAELQRNQKERQQLEEQRDRLAAMLAEMLLRPGA